MPTTEYQGSSAALAFFSRSLLSFHRNQVMSMEATHEEELQLQDLELFQKNIAGRFSDLSPSLPSSDAVNEPDNLLSIAWLQKLLDVFLCCEAEFKAALFLRRDASQMGKPPLDRLIPEFLDRAVKALDVCNAITHGVDTVRHWQKLAEMAVSALNQKPLGEGQIRRAKKALKSLLTSMNPQDRNSLNYRSTEHTKSYGRKAGGAAATKERSTTAHSRSLSWSVSTVSVSRTWSAAKQILAMSANLAVPRGVDSTRLALPVFIMSTVLVFVMWALVAAVPCQDRTGLLTHFAVPRQPGWTGPIIGLQERIAEEWKKKEKKGSAGLLDEMQRLERCGQTLVELADSVRFPLEAETVEEIGLLVAELAGTCRKMEDGLLPLQRQVREVFHRIVKSRSEFLDVLDQASKLSIPVT